MEHTPDTVQSVARSFALLEQLCAAPDGLALGQLCAQACMAKGTAHRLLASLITLGYAAQRPNTQRYHATLKIYELGCAVANHTNLVSTAVPYIEALAGDVQETVHLVVRDGAQAVYVHKAEGSRGMQMSSRLGKHIPLYCSGVGKAILATLPPPQVKALWQQSAVQKLTPHTVGTLPALEAQLHTVRQSGWALDDEENELGVRCVAVALAHPGQPAQAAFSISGIKAAMDDARTEQLAAACLRVQKQILGLPG